MTDRNEEHPDVTEISDLTEGLLAPARAEEVREHLTDCADCREVHASLEEIRGLLGDLPESTPMPRDVRERIDAALAAEALLSTEVPPAGAGDVVAAESPAGSSASAGSAGSSADPAEDDRATRRHEGAVVDSDVSRETSRPRADRPTGHAAAASGPGRSGGRRRAGHRRRTVVLGTAFAVAALGLGSLVVQSFTGGSDPESATTSAGDTERGEIAAFSGSELGNRVDGLLEQEKSAAPEAKKSPSFGVKASPGDSSRDGRKGDAEASVPACVTKGIGRSEKPLAAERGTYRDRDAYLVVLPDSADARRVSAYVVGADCVGKGAADNTKGTLLAEKSYPRN